MKGGMEGDAVQTSSDGHQVSTMESAVGRDDTPTLETTEQRLDKLEGDMRVVKEKLGLGGVVGADLPLREREPQAIAARSTSDDGANDAPRGVGDKAHERDKGVVYIINNDGSKHIFQDEKCVCNILLREDKIIISEILKKSSKKEYSQDDLLLDMKSFRERMEMEKKACAFFSMISNIGKINQIELVGSGCILNFLLNILKNLKDSNGNSFPDEKEIILAAEQFIDGDKVEYSEEVEGYVIKEEEQPELRLVELYKQIGFEEMSYEDAMAHLSGSGSFYYNENTKQPDWIL